MLPLARERELPYVFVTTQPENVPSQRVILANGGELIDASRNSTRTEAARRFAIAST